MNLCSRMLFSSNCSNIMVNSTCHGDITQPLCGDPELTQRMEQRSENGELSLGSRLAVCHLQTLSRIQLRVKGQLSPPRCLRIYLGNTFWCQPKSFLHLRLKFLPCCFSSLQAGPCMCNKFTQRLFQCLVYICEKLLHYYSSVSSLNHSLNGSVKQTVTNFLNTIY